MGDVFINSLRLFPPRVTQDAEVIYPLFESAMYPGELYAVPPYQSITTVSNPTATETSPNQYRFATSLEGYRPGHELDWLQLPGMAP